MTNSRSTNKGHNPLTRRTTRCLVNAGIPVDKEVILHAVQTGRIYPYVWPPNYGKKTHVEVCLWLRIDARTLPSRPPQVDVRPYPNNGLSYRANRCLSRSDIPATKKAVRHALKTGVLLPGKHPSNYGPQTHAELCRWTDINSVTLTSRALETLPSGHETRSAG